MKKYMLFMLCLTFGCTQKISFANLKENQFIVVHYRTAGCFHNMRYQLIFKKKNKVILAAKGSHPSESLKYIGQIEVTDKLERLDNLLQHYRTLQSNVICTSVESALLILQENNEVLICEEYTDRTCSVHRKKGVITFGELLYRLKQKMQSFNSKQSKKD